MNVKSCFVLGIFSILCCFIVSYASSKYTNMVFECISVWECTVHYGEKYFITVCTEPQQHNNVRHHATQHTQHTPHHTTTHHNTPHHTTPHHNTTRQYKAATFSPLAPHLHLQWHHTSVTANRVPRHHHLTPWPHHYQYTVWRCVGWGFALNAVLKDCTLNLGGL